MNKLTMYARRIFSDHKFILALASAICVGGWTVFTYFEEKRDPAPTSSTSTKLDDPNKKVEDNVNEQGRKRKDPPSAGATNKGSTVVTNSGDGAAVIVDSQVGDVNIEN